MFLEHPFITLGLALWCSYFLTRKIDAYTGLIVLGSCLPDIDGIIDLFLYPPDFSSTFFPSMVMHNRYFHSVGGLFLFALLAGILLRRFGLPFSLSSLSIGIGFGAHLVEDALVYNPCAAFFWPLSSERMGMGVFSQYTRGFFGVADITVLSLGTIFVLVSAIPWIVLWMGADRYDGSIEKIPTTLERENL